MLVTSSMLSHWQGIRSRNMYPGNDIHIDQVGVSGAKIADLEHAFMAEYSNLPKPWDVLVVSGYNDLARGRSPDEIITDLKSFKDKVTKHMDSSFSVATIPLPPSFSRLQNDAYSLARPDLTRNIVTLNNLIMEMNEEPNEFARTARAPRFHTWGLSSTRMPRSIGPRNILESMPAHAHKDWRERRPSNQLHLSDSVRLRMGRATVHYFKAIYGVET